MRTNRLNPARRNMRTAGLLILTFAVTLAGLFATTSQSKAAPVSLTFDNGRFTVGLFQNRVVLPASSTFPSDSLPVPQRTDIQLNGDLTDGKITIPASTNTGLQFPYMHLMHPIEQDLRIPLTIRLNEPGLTGTWDEATGAMTLAGKLDLIVITGTGTNFPLPDSLVDLGVPPLGLLARCRLNDVPVEFSTATQSPTMAEPFTEGFGKHGAMTTSWKTLDNAISENGGDCDQLNQLVSAAGGIWLSNGIVEPKPQPEPEPSCETDFRLCPAPTYTEIDDVRLRPGKKTVKPGSKLILTVRVHNSGNQAATNLKVRVKSSNRAFKVPPTVTLNVPAGRYATRKFVVNVKKGAKGRGQISAVSNGWVGRSYLKVQAKKTKKKSKPRR